jgi:hypothetical protein
MDPKEPSKGYLIVASRTKKFYKMGINLIRSLKDFYPEAQVCFVTEKLFCDGNESIADHLFYCGDNHREKLWALSQTPFDITMYIDADCEILHEDIKNAFKMLDGHDLMFTPLTVGRAHYFKKSKWDNGRLELNGGVFVYDIRNPLIKDFMNDWFYYYRQQQLGIWWPDLKDGKPDYDKHPKHLKAWDQFTLWWLINKNSKYKNIKLKLFDDDERWNWYSSYTEIENKSGKDIIVYHYSSVADKGNYL